MRNKAIIKAILSTMLTFAVFGGALCIMTMVCIYAPKWLQVLLSAVCVGYSVYRIFKIFHDQYRK